MDSPTPNAPRRTIGVSFRNSYARRVESGFMARYFSGEAILDIGYRGGDLNAQPITENAIGVELDYPGYDGVHLPFPDDSHEIEEALPVNSYRLRHLCDNDYGFDYSLTPDKPPSGGYEIELVLQKIAPPAWSDRLRYPSVVWAALDRLDQAIFHAMRANLTLPCEGARVLAAMIPALAYFPPWSRVRQNFLGQDEGALKQAARPLIELVRFDAEAYAKAYPDLRRAMEQGKLKDLRGHWLTSGYFEGRIGAPFDPFPPEG